MSSTPSDKSACEFRNRCLQICNDAYMAMAMAVGYRLKLFDNLPEEESEALSSERIASMHNYKERYVREWLSTMVCANIVEYKRDGEKFWLPTWRKELLSSSSHDGTVSMSHMLTLLTPVFGQIIHCFQADGPGGTSYADYKHFHKYLSEVTDKAHFAGLIDQFVPSVEGLQAKLESGVNVLDIGCGNGTPSFILAKAFPKSSFYGIDFCPEAIDYAKARANLDNLQYICCCAATGMKQDWTAHFDYVTAFDAIHDQAYPSLVLEEIYRVLKPGGTFSMIDIKGESDLSLDKHQPLSATWYTCSLFHCMPVSLNFENGEGLGNMWGKRKAAEMLQNAGFQLVDIREMPYNPSNYHYLCLKSKTTGHI